MAISVIDEKRTGNITVNPAQNFAGNVSVAESPMFQTNQTTAKLFGPQETQTTQQPQQQVQTPTTTPTTPTLDTELQSRVQATNGNLNANPNFVNAVVKAYTGRDATQEQLNQFTGKSVDMVRQSFAPQQNKEQILDVTETKQDLTPVTPTTDITTGLGSNADTYVNQVKSTYEQLSAPTEAQTGLEKTQTSLEDKYIELLTKQATQGARTLELQEQQDIQEKAQKLVDIDSKIQGTIAQYDKLAAQIESQPITTGLIVGQQSQAKKMLAADISVLSAQRAMLQGQYDVAQNAINNALELEFGDIQQNITNVKDFMAINESRMTREEKKQTDRTNIVMDAMQDILDEQKADKQNNYNLMIKVLENGGNASLIDMNATPEQNLARVGSLFAETKGVNTEIRSINGVDYIINSDTKEIIRRLDEGIEKPVDYKAIDYATNKIEEIDKLLNDKALGYAVGPNYISRDPYNIGNVTGAVQRVTGAIDQIVSKDTLDTLINLKKEGGTLGALSDQERIMLQTAATKIGGWAKTEPITGRRYYDVTEKDFKIELNKLKDLADKAIEEAGGGNILKLQNEIDKILIEYPNATNEDIQGILNEQGFNTVGSDTNQATKIASAIGQYESGGNYKALGPVTSNGDRAYGKYQVMGNNVPNWTREALGYSMTPQQFLNDRQAQDKVAQYKMGQYYDKYGSVADVATAWFAGPGAVGTNTQARDVIGTSTPTYIKNILSLYNKQT